MNRDLMPTVRESSMLPQRPRRCSERGAALIELAVSLPVLIMVLVGTADFARVFYYAIELTNAARAGAQYAAYSQVQAGQSAQIQATAQSAAPNISPITVTLVAPFPLCQCATNDGSLPLFQDPPTSPWCSSACPNPTSPSGRHLVETVTVTTTKTFTTFARIPGIPNTITLSRTATLRVALT
jgi:Flp pilus assembly protein TadG